MNTMKSNTEAKVILIGGYQVRLSLSGDDAILVEACPQQPEEENTFSDNARCVIIKMSNDVAPATSNVSTI